MPVDSESPEFTPSGLLRFEEAFTYASRLHALQVRKGTRIPYIAHLMSVAALVIENDGDEEQAMAALLHDAVEDQGGQSTLEDIRRRFGERVATIVEGCTDAYTDPKPAWKPRKEQYIEHLKHAPAEVRLVSLADKLHNARSVRNDTNQVGAAVWDRFSASREETLWYYRELLKVFTRAGDCPQMVTELTQILEELSRT